MQHIILTFTTNVITMGKEQHKPANAETNAKKIKVALMCISAIIIFWIGTNFLKGIDVFGKKTYFYAVLDNSGGLKESDPVLINGYRVGKVTSVKLLSAEPIRICAEVLLTENLGIPTDSKLEIAPKDILGGNVVNIIMGKSNQYAQNNDTLFSYIVPQMTDGLNEMKGQIGNILASVDTIGLSLKEALHSENGSNNLQQILENLESSTEHLNSILANNKDKVSRLMTDMEKFGNTLKAISPELTDVVSNIDQISDSLAQADIAATILNANRTIEEIKEVVTKINKGDGNLGKLANDENLYKNLEATTENLNKLMIDLRTNPGRYVHFSLFGKKDKDKKDKK